MSPGGTHHEGSPLEHASQKPHTLRALPPMQVVVGFVEEQELMHDELRSQLPMSFGERGSIVTGSSSLCPELQTSAGT